MKNFKQQAALNRALSIIQAIDDERFHWMMSCTHYSFNQEGEYHLTIWVQSSEIALSLKTQIMRYVMQDGDSIQIDECDSEESPYTITITTKY